MWNLEAGFCSSIIPTQQTITSSKSAIETPGKDVTYVQSQQQRYQKDINVNFEYIIIDFEQVNL